MEKLISIAGYNSYYSCSVTNISTGEEELIITTKSLESLINNIKIIDEEYSKIIFDNNDPKLRRYLLENYKEKLLSYTNIFNKETVGIFPSKKISSYGYNFEAGKSLEQATNLSKYIIIKSKGL